MQDTNDPGQFFDRTTRGPERRVHKTLLRRVRAPQRVDHLAGSGSQAGLRPQPSGQTGSVGHPDLRPRRTAQAFASTHLPSALEAKHVEQARSKAGPDSATERHDRGNRWWTARRLEQQPSLSPSRALSSHGSPSPQGYPTAPPYGTFDYLSIFCTRTRIGLHRTVGERTLRTMPPKGRLAVQCVSPGTA